MNAKKIKKTIDDHIQALATIEVAQIKLKDLNGLYCNAVEAIEAIASDWIEKLADKHEVLSPYNTDFISIIPVKDDETLRINYGIDEFGESRELIVPYEMVFNTKLFIKKLQSEEQRNGDAKSLMIEMAEEADSPEIREQMYDFLKQEFENKEEI